MYTLIAFLVTFSALVLVHEAGHFFAARSRGVRVEEFGFGFPPRLFAREVGGTVYTLNLIPLGGFVKLYGETEAHARERKSFAARSFAEKMFIVLAGVGSNLIFTLAVLSGLLAVGTTQPLTHQYPGAKISHPQLVVTGVLPASPADHAGMKPGDSISAVNGQPVSSVEQLQSLLGRFLDQPVRLNISRLGQQMAIEATPERLDSAGGRVAIGVGLENIATIAYPVYLAPVYAVAESGFLAKEMLGVLQSLMGKLFIRHTTQDLGVTGPVGIAVMSGRVARMGVSSFLYFLALLSLNLALLNVLPLPALDGGRAAIIIGERIAGRSIHKKLENVIQLVGVVLILSLAVIVTVQDLHLYWPQIASAFGS